MCDSSGVVSFCFSIVLGITGGSGSVNVVVHICFCRMKSGAKFDWVRGDKLQGLCGANCIAGCRTITGLDGFSSRHMWRLCVWPPEHVDNEIHCVSVPPTIASLLLSLVCQIYVPFCTKVGP